MLSPELSLAFGLLLGFTVGTLAAWLSFVAMSLRKSGDTVVNVRIGGNQDAHQHEHFHAPTDGDAIDMRDVQQQDEDDDEDGGDFPDWSKNRDR